MSLPPPAPTPVPNETALLDAIVAAKLTQLAPPLRRWHAAAALRAHLRQGLAEAARRAFDPALAAEFAAHCPLPGVPPDAYRNRWLALPALGPALVGPRFRGGDLAHPFVDVVVSTALPRTVADYRAALAPLRARFAPFAPRRVRFFVPTHLPLDLAAFGGAASWDQRYLAAPLDRMLALPPPVGHARLTLAAPPDLDFYPWYVGVYDDLRRQRPEHREYARIEPRDAMAAYAAAGGLFLAAVDDRRAGVVAAFRDVDQGMRGFVVAELLFDRAHRGRGFGAALQRRLVEALPRQPGDLLIGTIDARNPAPLAVARRCGREDVGGYLWIDID